MLGFVAGARRTLESLSSPIPDRVIGDVLESDATATLTRLSSSEAIESNVSAGVLLFLVKGSTACLLAGFVALCFALVGKGCSGLAILKGCLSVAGDWAVEMSSCFCEGESFVTVQAFSTRTRGRVWKGE
jgi:hypothetical protein